MVYAIMHDKFRKQFRKCFTACSHNSRQVSPLAPPPAPGKRPRPLPRTANTNGHHDHDDDCEAECSVVKENGVEGVVEVEVLQQTWMERFDPCKY